MCQCDDMTWIFVLMFAELAQHGPNEEAEFLSQKPFQTNMEHLLDFFLLLFFSGFSQLSQLLVCLWHPIHGQ